MNEIISVRGEMQRGELPPDQHPALVYLASLAPTGRRAMAGKLSKVAELTAGTRDFLGLDWARLRYQHVAAVRTKLVELGYAPATINATLHAIRGVARAAWGLELISSDDYQRIRDVRPVRGSRLLAGRAVTSGEIGALVEACLRDEGPAGIRDVALIGLMFAGALRRAEVSSLKLDSYRPETSELVVTGKGFAERAIYLDNGARDAIEDYIAVRGDEPGRLFCPVDKAGRMQVGVRLSDRAIYRMLKRRVRQAGVRDLTPHDLRRTCLSTLLSLTDMSTCMNHAGHRQITSTVRYDRRGEETKKAAAAMLHLPYRSVRHRDD
ncbi:MAG: site-specific integrase [Armatimonadia bacterium]